jgi:hypothetical protein
VGRVEAVSVEERVVRRVYRKPPPEAFIPIRRPGRRVENRVLLLYYDLVGSLSRFVDPPGADETLREYFERVRLHLDGVIDEFWRLTRITEFILYSGRDPSPDMVAEAEDLYNTIKGVII